MEKKLQPKLRFKEFSEDWNTLELDHLIEISKEKHNPMKSEENYKCIELENLSQETGKLLGSFNSKEQQSIKNKFEKGQVLYGKLRPYLKKYYKPNFEGVCSSEIWVLNGKKISNDFLYELIKTHKFNLIANVSSGSKMPRADWNYMKEVPFGFPPLSEQEKIASFLSSVDSKIEKLEKKRELLSQYKKGIMQKIFSQEIRFSDENGNDYPQWVEKKLGEISEFRRGSFPQPYNLPKWYDDENGYPFVQVFDVDFNMKLKPKTKRKISSLATSSSVFVKKGSLIITIQGSIGRIALTQYDAYVDRTLLIFTKLNKNLNKEYFMYVLFLLFEIEKLKAPGGTIKTITKDKLKDFKVFLPCFEEQEKIAKFLSSIDKKIELVEREVEKNKEFKKGLLQQMFV